MRTTRVARTLFWITSTLIFSVSAFPQSPEQATAVVNVYGPGGPLPAMKDAAAEFERQHHVQINVVGGPSPNWLPKAKGDADIIFSGSEDMMTGLQLAMQGEIEPATIQPLYLRRAVILVRPGNPRHIKGLEDLTRPRTQVLVVNGAGQQGLWEDAAARTGNINTVSGLRANIKTVAKNSGAAREQWINDLTLDAWITWTIWQVSNPTLADQIPIAADSRIYRDCGVGLTKRGEANSTAEQFVAFLRSSEGAKIFRRWGWEANDRQ